MWPVSQRRLIALMTVLRASPLSLPIRAMDGHAVPLSSPKRIEIMTAILKAVELMRGSSASFL
ncbi:hypothetical protein [Aestuariivirga sp.]|uniref:hypothetical protein n=1 Tax=Aestuariivirga sp. TaxID=2650926 RepID=UPI00391BDC12